MKHRLLAIAILVVFGILKMPIERQIEHEQRDLHYHGQKVNMDVRLRVGQLGFVAALSGFRALVADVLWLESHTAWTRTEWGRMKGLFDAVTSLQPRNLTFWDMSAWHMAYNASVAARQNEEEPHEALRLRAEREYWKIGERYLLDGIQSNPDSSKLFEALGRVYREKFKDHEKASAMFDEATKRPDVMQYVHRFAAYELAEVPGREWEAYNRLKELYDRGEDEHLPTLLKLLRELEQKLNVPESQRIYKGEPQNPK